jgi:toxin ParE1/3/4
MRRVEFTPKARRDLEEIWEYSLERFGLDKAEAYLRDIQRAVMTVTEDPRRGLGCDQIRPGYRRFSVGSHVLFF